jgi:hypothetical protein
MCLFLHILSEYNLKYRKENASRTKMFGGILKTNLDIPWNSVKSYGFNVMPRGLPSPNSAEDEIG